MRLCAIELENFKGVSTRQRLELSPITLLFGPNSVGKSTVLQALHYLREILERQNVNPDKTVVGGGIDLGGFKNMVHNHELSRTIRIKVEIDLKGENGNERLPLNYQGVFEDIKRFNNFFSTRYLTGYNNDKLQFAIVENVGIETEVTWSDLLKVPYVSKYTVFMDKEKIASVISPPQKGRAVLTEINFKHPLICLFDEMNEEEIEENELFVESVVEMISPAGTELGEGISAFSQIMKVSQNEIDFDNPENYKIAVHTKLGALPLLNKTLVLELTDVFDEYKNTFSEEKSVNKTIESIEERKSLELQQAGLTDFLDELMLGPARIALDYLESMTYIGPIRAIPKRNYQPKLSPDSSRWANGLAAWDLLYEGSNDKLIKQVNSWLFEEKKLNTGYQLEKSENKIIPVPGHFHQLFERGLDEDDLGVLQELYNNLPTAKKLVLRDFHKGVLVEPIEVGVGIS